MAGEAFKSILFSFLVVISNGALNWTEINLPEDHIPFYLSNYPAVADSCRKDAACPFKDALDKEVCWGYEHGCKSQNSYSTPSCPGDHKGWVQTKQDQLGTFYTQGDFGYVRDQIREMMVMCEPTFVDDSSLECSKHLRFCRGRNIMINFTDLASRTEPIRYKMDVLKEGQIGGYCRLHKSRLVEECDHISPLQSWGPEMRHFAELTRRPIIEKDCDIVIEKPTFVLKIDATVNMYHHFCDFLNLYASQHVNSTHPTAFSTDVHILIWESYTYHSSFDAMWEAFSSHSLWDLKTFRGETVCFKNIVFPLLPRMIFGLFYNTPIIWGCEKSGLFHAFSKHILHRLNIPLHKRFNDKIHVTLLSRDTQYRKILNEEELVKALEQNEDFVVKKVVYNRNLKFKQQLEVTYNSDILIGIHGAGLTHLLFLPDWAVVFELYNCEDEGCYMDLARLRGIKYITWQDKSKLHQQDEGHHPDGGAHAKFTNYAFDVDEFMRLVKIGAKHVKYHKAFQAFHGFKQENEEIKRDKPRRDVERDDTNTDLKNKESKLKAEEFKNDISIHEKQDDGALKLKNNELEDNEEVNDKQTEPEMRETEKNKDKHHELEDNEDNDKQTELEPPETEKSDDKHDEL